MDRDEILDAFDLTDRVAVVTGGSRGIGRAIATGFSAMGAKVVVASRKVEACIETARSIEAAGGAALPVACHMGDLDAVAGLVEETVAAFGRLDIVVNNAANALALPIGSITPEAWDKSIGTNVRGPLFLVQHALPHLEASPSAAVLNILTAGIFTHGSHVALYVAGKSALLSLTRSMAAELVGKGIRVNAIAPGVVDTDMVRANPEPIQEAMVAGQLMRRMASPDEIVPAALYLCSDASSFMTGQVMTVDGGLTTH